MRSLVIVLFLFAVFCGVLGEHYSYYGLDVNRIKLQSNYYKPESWNNLAQNKYMKFTKINSTRNESKKYQQQRLVPDIKATQKEAIKVYKPNEDPKDFYQSSAYLKKIQNSRNAKHEAASVFPGRDVIYARKRFSQNRTNDRAQSMTNVCVRCPQDRTLVAKPGSKQVYLQAPQLTSCSGLKASRNIRFEHMYGPKFGSLVWEGSHVVVGRIVMGNTTLQHCKIHVHVITQRCSVPTHLIAHCDESHSVCNFSCRDSSLDMLGPSNMSCSGGKWADYLPICRARTWCEPLMPPDHGHLSCQGKTTQGNKGLMEGSRCRVQCRKGFRFSPKFASVCRRGVWTHTLTCLPRRSHR